MVHGDEKLMRYESSVFTFVCLESPRVLRVGCVINEDKRIKIMGLKSTRETLHRNREAELIRVNKIKNGNKECTGTGNTLH